MAGPARDRDSRGGMLPHGTVKHPARFLMPARDRDSRGGMLQQLLFNCPVVPAAMLWACTDTRDWDVYIAAACHSNCDAGMVRLAAVSDRAAVRVAVAHNPSCPVDVLGLLASDESVAVRWEVARLGSCECGDARHAVA